MNGNRALEFLQAVYMDEELPLLTRVRVAIACLPFETPKLAVTAQVTEQDFATLLDRRLENLKRIEATNGNANKVIEAQPVEPEPVKPAPLPAPLNRLYSNRFRRRA